MPKGLFQPIEERNFDRIEFESLRRVVDPAFNVAHDELSVAYYNHWRHGKSHPWRGYDVQATPEESKGLFDKLHGLIWHLYEVKLDKENKKLPKPKRFEALLTEDKQAQVEETKAKILQSTADGVELTI